MTGASGYTIHKFKSDAFSAALSQTLWLQLGDVSTKLRSYEIAVRSRNYPFGGQNPQPFNKQFDRARATAIWATSTVRTSQGRAYIAERIRASRSSNVIKVQNGDVQFNDDLKVGRWLHIYNQNHDLGSGNTGGEMWNKPYARKIVAITPGTLGNPTTITLNDKLPANGGASIVEGSEVLIGASEFADDAYAKSFANAAQGRLGAMHEWQTKNMIEFKFQIQPKEACDVKLPGGAGKLLVFDITRALQGGSSINGTTTPKKSLPLGDEWVNDDSGDNDEDNTPNDGKIFSRDIPGWQWPNPKVGNWGFPTNFASPVGTTLKHHIPFAREFVRVKINAGNFTHSHTDTAGNNWQAPQGSRCSDFVEWESMFNGTVNWVYSGTSYKFKMLNWMGAENYIRKRP